MTETPPHRIALEGCSNLRDLGGYRTADGRRLRRGVVFRSASLSRLSDTDLRVLEEMGLRTVVDLRGEHEAQVAPSRLPLGAQLVPMPIEPLVGGSIRDLLKRESATGEDVVGLLAQAYVAYGTSHIGVYRALFDLLLQPGRPALLFHCSAGKDRTGFGAALLLSVLGVPRATVMEDYIATDRFWQREYALPAGTPKPMADALYGTHPTLLEAALVAAVQPFGSFEGLVVDGLGLDAPRLAALKALLLEA